MITFACVVALAAVLLLPVSLLHRVWTQSLAKWLYDAALKPGPSLVPTSTPPSGS